MGEKFNAFYKNSQWIFTIDFSAVTAGLNFYNLYVFR